MVNIYTKEVIKIKANLRDSSAFPAEQLFSLPTTGTPLPVTAQCPSLLYLSGCDLECDTETFPASSGSLYRKGEGSDGRVLMAANS